jgi:hypothetical protein
VTSPQRPRARLVLAGLLATLACASSLAPIAPATAAVPTVRSLAVPVAGVLPAKAAKATKITKDLPPTVTVSRYGTRTSARLKVKATGTKLRYVWQYQAPGKTIWTKIKKGKSAKLTVTDKWSTGSGFRVVVKGKKGNATSATSVLTVLSPSNTPAADAQTRFGLTGLTQGVDLSAYQYGANIAAVAAWAGTGGFTMLRAASGARPVRTGYVSLCGGAKLNTGVVPAVEDCAYAGFAARSASAGMRLGHYWFNGWIAGTDPTPTQAFANGYSVRDSAAQFVAWVTRDGSYTATSTDPLVLDVEKGRAWKASSAGHSYTVKLRHGREGVAAESQPVRLHERERGCEEGSGRQLPVGAAGDDHPTVGRVLGHEQRTGAGRAAEDRAVACVVDLAVQLQPAHLR